jgi:hypothetical protein
MRFTRHSSPFKKSQTQSITTLLVGAMLITPIAAAYVAHADDDTPPRIGSEKLKRQILASLDDPTPPAPPSQSDSEKTPADQGFRFSKKGPIQYRQSFQIGDDNVLLKLYGPVVRKKPGLRFRVEGFDIDDHPVDIEGFGNTKGGGCRFTIRF